MDTVERIARLQQRIAELAAGKEIDAKHITVLLSTQRQREFDNEWRRQQTLRRQKKPAALTTYETLHRQCASLRARCLSSPSRTKSEQATLIKLQTKWQTAIDGAHAEIAKQLKKRAALTEWLDRAVVDIDDIDETVLNASNQKTVKHNNTVLNDSYERLPVLVTSKNERRRVTQEERFGWQTKRDIRLRLLRETLAELNDNLLAELEREQFKREVRAARVFMDAYVAAAKDGRNAMAEANAALQRNGFRRLDVQYSRGMNKRDREVREMEAALLKRFEAAMTDEEREQLTMSKEFDAQGAKRGK
jgi:hypothetical protein